METVLLGVQFYSGEEHISLPPWPNTMNLYFFPSFTKELSMFDSSQAERVLTGGKNKNMWGVEVVLFLFNLWWGGVVSI